MDYLSTRLISSFLVAMIVSQTGSFSQFATRNTLASPSTLGLDGLAVFWLLTSHSVLLLFNYEISTLELLLSGLPFFLIIGLLYAKIFQEQRKIERVIFLGLTFNLLVGAIFSLWQFIFMAMNLPFPSELWFGHFRFPLPEFIPYLVIIEILTFFGLYRWKKNFIITSLGPKVSPLDDRFFLKFLFIFIALGTFVVVCLFGAFSFVGLIFPIISRKLFFKKFDLFGEIVLGSIFNGICFMLIDFICYQFPLFGAELPMGLLATIIGAMSLIFLLWQSNRTERLVKLNK